MAGMGERADIDATQSVRRSLPTKRWKPRARAGPLIDALAGFMFVLLAGGCWLMIEAGGAWNDDSATAAALRP
ncbi:MAG: hypothetical protein ACE5FO_13380, partial [Parvularculaceae bacterium]